MYSAGVQTIVHADVLARFAHALSDSTRAQVMLALLDSPAYPADLADSIGVSRQGLSNHLACLRGCGLVVAVPEGRRTRYELADARLRGVFDRPRRWSLDDDAAVWVWLQRRLRLARRRELGNCRDRLERGIDPQIPEHDPERSCSIKNLKRDSDPTL